MPKIVEGVEYLDTKEICKELGVSKGVFYDNIKSRLRTQLFDGRKKPWYHKSDVTALQLGRPVRKASIVISGIMSDWPGYLASLGFHAQTENRSVEVTTLPEDAIHTFRLPAEKPFVKRSRISYADGNPICTWDTYYPLDLIADILDDLMKGTASNIVEHIKEKHGLVIARAIDKYTARDTDLSEQNIFRLLTDEPVLILQRVSYTKDKRVLVLYSNIVLLGSWFAPEHEYDVEIFE